MKYPRDAAWSELRTAIWRFDPAGIQELETDIPHEYDEVIRGIQARLLRGAGRIEIVKWLAEELNGRWGLELFPRVVELLADDLISAWNEWVSSQ